ncbi:MAG: lipopolysaccharide biosynthesis protein [Alphaproteobacteria bacterium]|nr:lipopolysaccharide biosynthesis protein [Alphaproteobacteria bacterium]
MLHKYRPNSVLQLCAGFRDVWRNWTADVLLRRLISNASLLLGGKAVTAVFGIGYLALAARGLSLEAFGTLILIHTYTQAVGDITKFQSWQVVLSYGTPAWNEGRKGDFRRILRFSVRLDLYGAVAGLALALLGIPLAQTLFGWSADTAHWATVYVLSVVFFDVATSTGILRLFDRFDLTALQSSLGAFIRLVGTAAAFIYGWGLPFYLAVWMTAQIFPCLVLIGMAMRVLRHQGAFETPRERPDVTGGGWRPDRQVWGFVWSANLNTTLQLVLTHFGTLAVGAMLGAPAAALYRIARQITEAIAMPVKLLTPTIYPELARLATRRAFSEIRRFMLRASVLAGFGATALICVLVFAGPWLLLTVAGDNFTPAYGVMVVLALAAAIRLWSFPLEPMLITSGRAVAAFQVRLVTTILYIVLMFFLCPRLGLMGAGYALVIASLTNLAGQLMVAENWFRQNRAAG